MVMVFTLVSLCQEFLDTAAQQAHDRKEYEKKREEREEEQRQLVRQGLNDFFRNALQNVLGVKYKWHFRKLPEVPEVPVITTTMKWLSSATTSVI